MGVGRKIVPVWLQNTIPKLMWILIKSSTQTHYLISISEFQVIIIVQHSILFNRIVFNWLILAAFDNVPK